MTGEISGVKKKRPTGVIVIAVFLIISAVLGLLTYTIIFIYPSYYSSTVIGRIITITAPIFMILYIVAAVGLLKLKEWARKLTIASIWIAFITGLTEAYVTLWS